MTSLFVNRNRQKQVIQKNRRVGLYGLKERMMGVCRLFQIRQGTQI